MKTLSNPSAAGEGATTSLFDAGRPRRAVLGSVLHSATLKFALAGCLQLSWPGSREISKIQSAWQYGEPILLMTPLLMTLP